jgi:hypothetical protein
LAVIHLERHVSSLASLLRKREHAWRNISDKDVVRLPTSTYV